MCSLCVCVRRIILSLFITVCAHSPLSTSLSLSGGYQNFHSQYPELCTEVKTIDQSGTETEKRVNSHSGTLSHHKPDYDQVWKHPIALPTLPRRAHIIHLPLFFFNHIKKTTSKPCWHQRGLYSASKHFLNIRMIFPDLHCSQTTSSVAHKGGETSDARLKSGNLTEKTTFISDLSSSSSTVQITRLLHIWKNPLLCLFIALNGLHNRVNPFPQLRSSVCIWSADGHDVLLCSVFWAHRCLDVVAWTNGCIFSGLG